MPTLVMLVSGAAVATGAATGIGMHSPCLFRRVPFLHRSFFSFLSRFGLVRLAATTGGVGIGGVGIGGVGVGVGPDD